MGLIIYPLQPFIRAWRAACDFNGKSRLVIPGGTFILSQVVFGGPCSGPAPKIVQVIGNLKATTDISEYSSPEWILFESITGLVITGKGTFDGRGDAVWEYNDCKNNQNCVQLPSVSFPLHILYISRSVFLAIFPLYLYIYDEIYMCVY